MSYNILFYGKKPLLRYTVIRRTNVAYDVLCSKRISQGVRIPILPPFTPMVLPARRGAQRETAYLYAHKLRYFRIIVSLTGTGSCRCARSMCPSGRNTDTGANWAGDRSAAIQGARTSPTTFCRASLPFWTFPPARRSVRWTRQTSHGTAGRP